MHILMAVMLAWVLNLVVGAAVLAAVDDENQRLYRWYSECPLPFLVQPLLLSLWPAMVWVAWKMRRAT